MSWLHRLPHSHRSAPGLEWALLRRMPRILLLGTLLPVLVAGVAHLLPWAGSTDGVVATLGMVDIYALAAIILHWTLVLTLAIGCFIVMVMKGPAYVADAYPLPDADRPAR